MCPLLRGVYAALARAYHGAGSHFFLLPLKEGVEAVSSRVAVLLGGTAMTLAILTMAAVAWARGGDPLIKNLEPGSGETITDTTFTIEATVKDRQTNLGKKHIRLFLDGTRRTDFSYNRRTNRLSYTPPDPLALGAHKVKIVAKDADRNTKRKSWSFTVSSGCNAGCITYTGEWTRQTLSTASGGSTEYATDSGAKGPDRGKAEVWIDGVKAATVDLYSSSAQPRKMVFTKNWDSADSHTLEIRATGTKNAASSGTRIDVDAFVVLG
jgi:hypothetical protein